MALSIEQLIEAVRARGVRPSVADHVSPDVSLSVKTVDAVREYLDELEPFDVARGGEFCWHDALWREMPDDLVARFTHRIGSLHAVRACRDNGGSRCSRARSPTSSRPRRT